MRWDERLEAFLIAKLPRMTEGQELLLAMALTVATINLVFWYWN